MRLKNKMLASTFIATMSGMWLAAVPSAFAEEADSQPEDVFVLDEIFVTAQKRGEQRLIDVPVSVAVISEDSIRLAGLRNVNDIVNATAGITMFSSQGVPGSRNLQIRGVSSQAGARATVGYYWDEAPVNIGLSVAPNGSALDINRVEILRGPQGTVFGEGSMGGTIRFISNKPDLEEIGGSFTAGYSQTRDGDNGWSLGGVLNLPLAKEKFGIRVAARYDDIGGFIDNPLSGAEDINSQEQHQVRVKALLKPTEAVSVEFTYFRDRNDFDGRDVAMDVENYEFNSLATEEGFNNLDMFNLTVEADLGFANLTSSSTYLEAEHSVPIRIDQGPLFGSNTDALIDSEVKTTELRLVSKPDSAVFWTFGGIYTKKEIDQIANVDLTLLLPSDPALAALGAAPGFTQTNVVLQGSIFEPTESWALFGEIGYDLTEKVTLTVGARYFKSNFDAVNNTTTDTVATFLNPALEPYTDPGFWSLIGFANPTVVSTTDVAMPSGSDDAFTPRINLSYAFSDDANMYISAAKGFRSGGTNAIISTPNSLDPANPIVYPEQYLSESLWTFELGAKGYALDSRLYLEGAIYYTDWSDIQTQITPAGASVSGIINGESAEIYGFDASVQFFATPTLTLSAAVNYTHHQFKLSPEFDAGTTAFIDGDPLPNVPDWSANASLTWRPALTDTLNGLFNAVVVYQDETFEADRDNLLEPLSRMEDRVLVNMRAGVETENWSAYIYAANLFDKRGLAAPISASNTATVGAPVLTPRKIGFEVNYNF